MAVIVQKYGGTSVADAERIRSVAQRIIGTRNRGDDVVAVVSAMGDTTDHLIDLAKQVCKSPDPREMDLLLSTGELVSSALLAMALRELGQDAVSLSGLQAGIRTEKRFGRARITRINSERIEKEIHRGRVVIVAGFQGVTEGMDVTTLLKDISYDEMLELASYGAKVMHPRAVELGSVYNVPIFVASSFTSSPGTLIHGGTMMEITDKVRGIAHDTDVAKVTIRGVPDRPGVASAIFQPLCDAQIRVDTIVQNASAEGVTDMTFTVAKGDLEQAIKAVEPRIRKLKAKGYAADDRLAKVSVVGVAMSKGHGYAGRMFQTLYQAGINIEMITTSEIRITCLIDRQRVPDAVRALHSAFRLATLDGE
ncbi:MAG: aspartate kinase [Chloroflexi bacterium]|nr:aspartate kinase [Chloroflexota bacterium]